MKRVVQILLALFLVFFVGSVLIGIGMAIGVMSPPDEKVSKDAIMSLDLDGIIVDGRDFLELLRKYRDDEHIKGVLIRISSPGGVVGPSQEIYDEIKRTREQFKKPVVAYCASVAASGAYYAAVGADKIVTTPGCLMGSIGVLMEFVNLEKLYDWAKIKRYALTTGKYKDAGAEYKAMDPEAKVLFQDMLNDVLRQFKQAIVDGRKMKPEFLDKYADGRIFTGAQAVDLGFADQTGSYGDALKVIGKMTELGDEPKVFEPRKKRGFFELLEEASEARFENVADKMLRTKLNARPLYLLPGAMNF